MNTIKNIKNSIDAFIIEYEDSSLNLKSYSDEKNIYVDITNLNLISSIKTAVLTSTYCFLNDFQKNICWMVKDIEIKKSISILCLKNTKCIVDGELLAKEIA